MTKEDFLARCENAFDMGLITPERLNLMERWLDVVMREGHSRMCDKDGRHQAQWEHVRDFWERWGELERLEKNSGADYLATLANDVDGYALIQFAAILRHPCPVCASDPKAWHTRSALCPHKEKGAE